MRKKLIEIILIFAFTVVTTIITSVNYFSQWISRPPDRVFIGMTTYFEDFYYYLDQFYQGKEGRLLTLNRFSTEQFPATIVYMNHIFFGKIGGWLGWEPFQSYNYFGILFKFIFMLSGYALIRVLMQNSIRQRLYAYLIFLYSTGLPNISFKSGSVTFNRIQDIFRAENRLMARFGTSPNGMYINFIFILLFILLYKFFETNHTSAQKNKKTGKSTLINAIQIISIFLLFVNLTLTDFTKSLVLLGIFTVLFLVKYWKNIINLEYLSFKCIMLVLYLVFIIIGLWIYFAIDADPVYKQANIWDISQYLQQVKAIGLGNMLKGFGLQLPLFLWGYLLLLRKKSKTDTEIALLITTGTAVLGYAFPLIYQIPIPGFRFIFPAIYVFTCMIVLTAIRDIAGRIRWKNTFSIIFILYISVNILAILPGVLADTKIPQKPEYNFTFLNKDLYAALIYLRTAEPLDSNVLASPYTSIDLMIPGIAGRYTYTGHFLTTYNSKQKDQNATRFFNEWTDRPGTRTFLKANNIRLILVDKYTAKLNDFKIYYPFLKVVFENPAAVIFRYDY
jgi:hypothetical protein